MKHVGMGEVWELDSVCSLGCSPSMLHQTENAALVAIATHRTTSYNLTGIVSCTKHDIWSGTSEVE